MLSLWNPLLPVTSIKSDKEISKRDLFDRVVESAWNDLFVGLAGNNSFGIEYYKTEEGISVDIDMPGVKPSDLDVKLENALITIKAERKTKQSSYSTSKSFTVPEGYSADDVAAHLSDGILTLSFKKIPVPEKNVKQIEVKTTNTLT